MRLVFGLVFVLLLGACAAQPKTTQCPEPRPQVCTMEYAPTCVIQADGTHKEYSSPCNACAHDAVEAFLPGACPE